jgi:hypothetical protein
MRYSLLHLLHHVKLAEPVEIRLSGGDLFVDHILL